MDMYITFHTFAYFWFTHQNISGLQQASNMDWNAQLLTDIDWLERLLIAIALHVVLHITCARVSMDLGTV